VEEAERVLEEAVVSGQPSRPSAWSLLPQGAKDWNSAGILFGVAFDAKRGRDHAEGGGILFGMNEYRHVPVEVGHLAILSFKGQFRGDVLHTIREKGQVHLRHRGNLSSG